MLGSWWGSKVNPGKASEAAEAKLEVNAVADREEAKGKGDKVDGEVEGEGKAEKVSNIKSRKMIRKLNDSMFCFKTFGQHWVKMKSQTKKKIKFPKSVQSMKMIKVDSLETQTNIDCFYIKFIGNQWSDKLSWGQFDPLFLAFEIKQTKQNKVSHRRNDDYDWSDYSLNIVPVMLLLLLWAFFDLRASKVHLVVAESTQWVLYNNQWNEDWHASGWRW